MLLNLKHWVGTIFGGSTLRGVQSEAFRFSRSDDLRLILGTIFVYIRTIGSHHLLL